MFLRPYPTKLSWFDSGAACRFRDIRVFRTPTTKSGQNERTCTHHTHTPTTHPSIAVRFFVVFIATGARLVTRAQVLRVRAHTLTKKKRSTVTFFFVTFFFRARARKFFSNFFAPIGLKLSRKMRLDETSTYVPISSR